MRTWLLIIGAVSGLVGSCVSIYKLNKMSKADNDPIIQAVNEEVKAEVELKKAEADKKATEKKEAEEAAKKAEVAEEVAKKTAEDAAKKAETVKKNETPKKD